MPPSIGGTSFPQLSGQSEMARDASLLVTRAPATTSSNVHKAVNTAKRLSPRDRVERAPAEWGGQFWPQPALAGFRCCPARPATSRLPHFFMRFCGPPALRNRRQRPIVCPAAYPLIVKSSVLLSLAPTVICCSCVPYFSCQT